MEQEAVTQRVLDALARLPVRGLLTLGPALESIEVSPPPNVAVHSFVPHADVLPHASAVVTHAGQGTAMVALAHGVPLVCTPLGRDQNTVAARVQACGAGIALPPTATAPRVRRAVGNVLADAAYARGARRMATAIRRYGNGSRAVELLEALASPQASRRRATRPAA